MNHNIDILNKIQVTSFANLFEADQLINYAVVISNVLIGLRNAHELRWKQWLGSSKEYSKYGCK